MNNRTLLWIVAAGVGALLVISALARRHGAGGVEPVSAASPEPDPTPIVPQPSRSFSVAPAPVRPTEPTPPAPRTEVAQTRPTSRSAATRPVRPATFKDAVVDDQLTPQKIARVALGYVGADPAAELVWEAAINNPNFTPDQRKDLIEDLNEEGFDDPKNLTAADLPLVVSRIQLIENLAPQSADEVNARAFAEAYKDLLNMYAKLTK